MSYPGQFPQQYQPYQQPRQSGSSWPMILGVLGGGGLLLALVCCGGLAMVFRTPSASAAAKEPFTIADVPSPAFEERADAERQELEPGVLQYEIKIGDRDGGIYETPGHGGYMILNLPQGEHRAKSLPCVLIAPSGSSLLEGRDLRWGRHRAEHIPYVKAGCAVLSYELDGPCEADGDPGVVLPAYDAFRNSRAGLVNARNALEYVLVKVPEVDPARIYAAGHSSAATHALLFAEHEPRLAGVIAYAPATDLPKRMGPQMPLLRFVLPGVVDFVTQSSPSTHVAALKCPTFLFHAEDDSNCPIADTRVFADKLKQQGTDVKLVTAATGEHYDSMIDEGIPSAIQWLHDRQAIK